MLLKNALVGWRGMLWGLMNTRRKQRQIGRVVEHLEPRWLLADFGDAPDTGAGTGRGDYQTLAANGGPSHTIVAGLFLGARVDDDANGVPNTRANGDDITGSPDDEDGVVYPDSDLVLTVGTQPTVTLRATNTTGANANLFGWIDYNADGVFDNLRERAQVIVQTGTNNGSFTLLFPVVPSEFRGTTYARFRFSTDNAASNSTGFASDGEVEDYAVTILGPSSGTVKSSLKIGSQLNGGPALNDGDFFGAAIVNLGDTDGDGVRDIAVGAPLDDTGGTNRGAVYVMRMNANGSVKSSTKIASGLNGDPTLSDFDLFGNSAVSLGDIDGDGVVDLAVGAYLDDTGGLNRGAVHIVRLNADGTVKSSSKIASGLNGGPQLNDDDRFGFSVASVGDMDGDGVTDIAVGAFLDDTGGDARGAVHLLRLNGDGSVKSTVKIASGLNGGPVLANTDFFGLSVGSPGDVDGDGIADLVVGASRDAGGGFVRGAVHVLFLRSDGTVRSSTKIGSQSNGGPPLSDGDQFGRSVAGLGDLDGDGVPDLVVGAFGDDTGSLERGAIYVVRLTVDGSARSFTKIGNGLNGGPVLANGDNFGSGFEPLGDWDGDGVLDLAVGAFKDNLGGVDRGTIHILRLNAGIALRDFGDAPDTAAGSGSGNYRTLVTDNGPSHGIVSGLLLGARLSGESGAQPESRARGDDLGLDDEDGVFQPDQDLTLTAGTQPVVRLRATNTTDSPAVLHGWIDFNGDGVFDDRAERARIEIPPATVNEVVSLVFPVVPQSFAGKTFARFRLSTDVRAAAPTGEATDGEVEDYAVRIVIPGNGTVRAPNGFTEIASGTNGGPTLVDGDSFGSSVAALGDLDGDGVGDLAVGTTGDDTNGGDPNANRGAVYVLRLNPDGTVKASMKIASGTNGGPTLANGDVFGISLTGLGDVDGDGVRDLAVGAFGDDSGGADRGAVYVLRLNADGTVKAHTKIASGANGGPTLANGDLFGISLTGLGDVDGDGVGDLAVGAYRDDTGGTDRGAVYVLRLNADGTVKTHTKIASGANGGPTLTDNDNFGRSVATVGDVDGDGVGDLAVGAFRDDMGGDNRGAVYVLRLNADGTVKSSTKLANGTNGGPTLVDGDLFGTSVAGLGDLDGDGVGDLTVGARGDDTGGTDRGAVYVLRLNADGTVKSNTKLTSGMNGAPPLANFDRFGFTAAALGDMDGDGVGDLAVGVSGDDTGGTDHGAVYVLRLNAGSALPDYADAPDTGMGTGRGNYQTNTDDGGPSHGIVSGLLLGTRIGGESAASPGARANGDDLGIDDEDGVLNPLSDLVLTTGTQPTVTLRATNTTGTNASLYGWIDFNADGVFDSSRERAEASVPSGTDKGLVTLVFPVIPTGFSGATFARFRLSTDVSAAQPFGPAVDGEVEDYLVRIEGPSDGTVKSASLIGSGLNGGPVLADFDFFGSAVAWTGDMDGDGVSDLIVGAPSDNTGGIDRGALHVLRMNADGTVKSSTKLASGLNGLPTLGDGDRFGFSVAVIGDIDGDEVIDIAVGAIQDDTGASNQGAVYIVRLRSDGTVKGTAKIADGMHGGPDLSPGDLFGSAVASAGDLDGDGVTDLAVGAFGDDSGGPDVGAVYVLMLRPDGRVKASTKVSNGINGGPLLAASDSFGISVAAVGDVDGDGLGDLVVGASQSNSGTNSGGAIFTLLMNTDGTVRSSVRIASGVNGGPTIGSRSLFGRSVTAIGDVDGDGIRDLAVGANGDSIGGAFRGAVYILTMNSDATSKAVTTIASGINGPTLSLYDNFGISVSSIGDLDGDGIADLAVGASGDDTGGDNRGAIYIIRLNTGSPLRDRGDAPDTGLGADRGNYQTTAADSGPSHAVVLGLLLGTRIGGDTNASPGLRANGDDLGIDDEDGVLNPLSDLVLTVGTSATITLRATNTTGVAATLSGWIDFNANGVFDNTTERVRVTVPTGTVGGTFTLVFPSVPAGFVGTTYARFRLGTDAAAGNPTGDSNGGEVEDYAVTITVPGRGVVRLDGIGETPDPFAGGVALEPGERFGSATAALGDLNGDGFPDLAVGSRRLGSDDGLPGQYSGGGRVHIQFLGAGGAVLSSRILTTDNASTGLPRLQNARFGASLANVGDLDGDGIVDLAVGAPLDDTGGTGDLAERGAVFILFLNADGSLKRFQKIAHETNGGPTLADRDYFGSSLALVGDIDGDGLPELAVGATGDDTGGSLRGTVYLLSLARDGSARGRVKLVSGGGGVPRLKNGDRFGGAVASLGDLDGDGVPEIAVGAAGTDSNDGTLADQGAVYVLFLNRDGTTKPSKNRRLGQLPAFGLNLNDNDRFGSSLASLGDLNGDGLADLAIGAPGDRLLGAGTGEVYVLFLGADGTPRSSAVRLSDKPATPLAVLEGDNFGSSVANLGDMDGDGVIDLAVGAMFDDAGGSANADKGTVYLLRLEVSRLGVFGTVFEDFDGDGTRGFGEPAFPGATVYLDLNNDGDFDTGEPTRSTNSFGQYAFEITDADVSPLVPGTRPVSFTVRQNAGPGLLQTAPGARSHYVVFPDRLRSFVDLDFGNVRLTAGDRVLSIPDRILKSGDTLTLPISLSDTSGVNAINYTLVFDNSVVEILSVENGSLTSSWTFSERNIDNAAGRVDVEMASFTALGAGSGEVGRITLRVKANVADGRASPLRFVDGNVFPFLGAATVLNGGTIPFLEGEGAVLVINPPTLRVDEVVVEPSGVNLKFNLPFGTSMLNLYRGFERGDNTPDVLLVGSNGPVPGSLVLAADRLSARFVATGGVLAAGTYTLTLASGATGWQTPAGQQLDGNFDGLPGDAFTRTITVEGPAARIVSLPDFARGAGQPGHLPTSATGIPVLVSDGASLTRIELELTYDPSLLTITGVRKGANLPGNWTITPDFTNAASGRVSWIAQGGTALSSGLAELFRLDANVPNTAEYAGGHALRWTRVLLNSGAIAGLGDDAIHKAVYLGDVTGSRGYSTLDAAFTQRVSVGLETGFDPYLLTDPLIVADINGNGQLEGTDALEIARKAVLLPTPLIPDLPNVLPPLFGDGVDPTVSFGTATLTRGQRSDVPLSIDTTATGLLGVELTVRYDTTVFNQAAGDFTLGSRLAGYTVVTNLLPDGRQIIGAFNTTPVSSAGGELFRLSLNTRANAPLGPTTLQLTQDPSALDQGRQAELNEGRLVLSFANDGLFMPTVRTVPADPTGLNLPTTTVAENQMAGAVVGTLTTTDPNPDDTTFTYTLVAGSGDTDNGRFEIVGSQLRTRQVFDFEARNSYSVRVRTTDPTGRTFDRVVTVTVSDVNEPPTAVTFTGNPAAAVTIAENTGMPLAVATVAVADDATGQRNLSLSGADTAAFELVGNVLRLRAGNVLDFESGRRTYTVTVNVDDPGVGPTPDASATFTVSVGDVNEAPTAVTLVNPVTSLSANTSTASPVRVADLSIIDDALGAETVTLAGDDAVHFEVSGLQLRFKANTPLRQLADSGKTGFSVTVRVDDPTVGGSVDASVVVNVGMSDLNAAPTAVTFANAATTLPESTSTTNAVKVADISITDDASGTNNITLAGADAGAFVVLPGNQLHLRAGTALDFESGKRTYSVTVNVDDPTVGGLVDATSTFTLTITNTNDAPTLNTAGSPYYIAGAGSLLPIELINGILVSDLLARGAGGDPIADVDNGAQRGIALTNADGRFGTWQYTTVANPQESNWTNIGAVSDGSALLLAADATTRIRHTTGLIPHHAAGAPFLPLESKLVDGLRFRAWDRSSGTAGTKADTTANGGSTPFSTEVESANVYFETRMFRVFNTNAGLNVYGLQAEYNSLVATPGFADRSTSGFTGFTVLMSDVPELGTLPLFRLYFGVQFNDNGTETDMGYRYLTTSAGEASMLEGLGRADKRSARQGAYFREIGDPANPSDTGVNNRTGIIGYVFAGSQPGTAEMFQIYRTDTANKPTRPGGTPEGSTATSQRPQEQGDHVYTTNTAFETTRTGTWRVESSRGFVRPINPNPGTAAAFAAPLFPSVTGSSTPTFSASIASLPAPAPLATPPASAVADTGATAPRLEALIANPVDAPLPANECMSLEEASTEPAVPVEMEDGDSIPPFAPFDDLFTDGALLSDLLLFD